MFISGDGPGHVGVWKKEKGYTSEKFSARRYVISKKVKGKKFME
jgi:hypothetical protein